MRAVLTISILLACYQVGHAQIATQINISDTRLSQVEGYQRQWKAFKRDSLEKLNTYKQRAKEEAALLKQQIKDHKKYRLYTHTIDSLQSAFDRSRRTRDSLTSVKKNTDWKALYAQSLVVADEQLSGTQAYEALSPYRSLDREALTPDSLLSRWMVRSEELATRELEAQMTDHFQGLPEIQELTGEAEGMDMLNQARSSINPTQDRISKTFDKASQLSARDAFVSNKEKVIEAIQVLDTAKLKDKQLGSFDNGDERKDWSERLSYGGNLQVEISETTLIDFSPWMGWSIRKQWMWAIGANYKSAWTFNDGLDYMATDERVGARVFTECDFWKGIYVHGEAERLWQTYALSEGTDTSPSQGVNGWLLGLGKFYQIKGKLQGNFQVLYNFNYENDGPYHSLWIIRFGLRHN